MSGYRHPVYAESLAEFGRPRHLPASGGWILDRPIGVSDWHDAIGCYPLFCCMNWHGLNADIDMLGSEFVTLSLVSDPFGDFDLVQLRRCFEDQMVPFKAHFVADLRRSIRQIVSDHHRYYARRALASVVVERYENPVLLLDEWTALYSALIERHRLRGIKAFSRCSFTRQLSVPGLVLLRATYEGETVAAHLWYRQDDVAYSHLAATNRRGYELMAPYALHWFAIESFAGEARWLNFGAGSGISSDAGDGLTRFKKGWATDVRIAYFCGKIFDQQKYAHLLDERGAHGTAYFPAYRDGELA